MQPKEIKIGIWITNPPGHDVVKRVVWFDEKGVLAERQDGERSHYPSALLKDANIASPQQLTAAGVPDSQRLVEQRSEWDGVTFKSLTDKYHPQNLVSVHIDNSHAFYARATNDFLEIGTPRLYSYQFDVTGQCDPLRARPDVLQAVVKFRSERREAGLKWNLGDGWIYRVKNGRAEGWLNESKMWRPIAGPPDSSARVIMNCSDATPAQIAQSGCPIADVPESMKVEVERLRGVKATGEEEIWECECCGAHHALFKPANCMHCTCPRLKNIGKHNCKLSPSPAATRTAFDAEKIDIELAREGIVKVRQMISKCFRADRTSDDLFELGLALADVRKGLGLPSYLSTLAAGGEK